MHNSYLPPTENGLRVWANNLADRLNVDPERFGVPVDIAERLAVAAQEYDAAYQAASHITVRSRADVARKRTAEARLKREVKPIVSLLRGHAGTTDAERIELGLTIPSTSRTRVKSPEDAPRITVEGAEYRTISIRLYDAGTISRARPKGVIGAAVFCAVGPEPVAGTRWDFAGYTINNKLAVHLSDDVPAGSQVWFRAQWLSTRLETSPMSPIVVTNMPGGLGRVRPEAKGTPLLDAA